jgi:hypothetical protein
LVMVRIQNFLDDAPGAAPALPDETTPAWAAEQAMAILDQHVANGTNATGLVRFLTQWLYPDGPALAPTWAKKLLEPDATLATLLAEPTGEPHRLGVLTDPQFLSTRKSIAERGNFIMSQVLCTPIPPSPMGISSVLTDEGVTRRERYENTLGDNETCTSCHTLLDPTGFSLEHFDEQGAYRELDAGQAVDSSSALLPPAMSSLPTLSFDSFDELAPQLARSCAVAHCFTTKLAGDAFTAAELPAPSEDEINRAANAFVASSFAIRELVTAVVSSPSFLR